MDIGRPLLDRLLEDLVHQLDDRRVFRAPLDVFGLLLEPDGRLHGALFLGQDPLDGIGTHPVVLPDRLIDLVATGQHGLDFASEMQPILMRVEPRNSPVFSCSARARCSSSRVTSFFSTRISPICLAMFLFSSSDVYTSVGERSSCSERARRSFFSVRYSSLTSVEPSGSPVSRWR